MSPDTKQRFRAEPGAVTCEVLILDDVELNNTLMAQAISTIPNCQVCAFTDPKQALAEIERDPGRFGSVVTDYEMPGMNGIEFVRRAREVDGFLHVPAVMVTSFDQRRIRREALEAGVTDFMGKPFDSVEIRARLTNLLALNNARRAEQDRSAWLAREVAAATATIEAREREIVIRLARAAEYRDTDTGDHVARVASLVRAIAENSRLRSGLVSGPRTGVHHARYREGFGAGRRSTETGSAEARGTESDPKAHRAWLRHTGRQFIRRDPACGRDRDQPS